MKSPLGLLTILGCFFAILEPRAAAQNLPGSLSFAVSGSFLNGVGQNQSSILIADNDLTNGYAQGMDLQDAPTTLNPDGPVGSAAFQWGVPSGSSDYPHTSALWFEPRAINNVAADQYFDIGYLYYRNGTIKTTTGAASVDLGLRLNFTQPTGVAPLNIIYTSDLINSVNSNDPVASADIVSLRNQAAPLDFMDASGNRYYLELTFKVDQNTIDGTLSTQDQFRVFEGGQGRAELVGRFTTTPGPVTVPEPSSALMVVFGAFALCRRKR